MKPERYMFTDNNLDQYYKPNIETVMNPYTVEEYDMEGYKVKETGYRYYERTGERLTQELIEEYKKVMMVDKSSWGVLKTKWYEYINNLTLDINS